MCSEATWISLSSGISPPCPGSCPHLLVCWIAYLQVSSMLLRSGIALAVPALPVGFSKCFSMLLKALGGEEGGKAKQV